MDSPWLTGRRRHAVMGGICAVCALLALLASRLLPEASVSRADHWIGDAVLLQGNRTPVEPSLVFLGIDPGSLQLDAVDPDIIEAEPGLRLMSEGYPWSREVYALLLDRLFAAGARLVVLDMVFPSPRGDAGDAAFAAALEKYRDRVVLGADFVEFPTAGMARTPMALRPPAVGLLPGDPLTDGRAGFVTFFADADGRVRQWRPSLTLAELNAFPDPDEARTPALAAAVLARLGHPEFLTDPAPRALRFADPDAWPAMPLYWVFDPALWRRNCQSGAVFKDRTVVLGALARDFQDVHQTPFGLMPGPSLHLNAINAGLQDGFYRTATPRVIWTSVILAAALAWLIAALVPRALLAAGLLLLAGALYAGALVLVFNTASLLLPGLWPLAALTASGAGALGWQAVVAGRQRARILRTLERMVSRDLARELMDDKAALRSWLSGVWRSPTVLHCGLHGLPAAEPDSSAAWSPEWMDALNGYVSCLQGTLDLHRAQRDPFTGSGLTAAWGTVKSQGAADDTRRALTAALDLRHRLTALRQAAVTAGQPWLTWGIGINHGPALFAGVGPGRQPEFAVMGGESSLAARLEALTPEYAADIIVSLSVVELAGDAWQFRPLDLVKVDGREKPVTLFALIARTADLPASELAWLQQWRSAMERYFGGYFAAAAQQFDLCRQERPDDPLCQEFVRRCQEFLQQPPPEGWDGVTQHTSH